MNSLMGCKKSLSMQNSRKIAKKNEINSYHRLLNHVYFLLLLGDKKVFNPTPKIPDWVGVKSF